MYGWDDAAWQQSARPPGCRTKAGSGAGGASGSAWVLQTDAWAVAFQYRDMPATEKDVFKKKQRAFSQSHVEQLFFPVNILRVLNLPIDPRRSIRSWSPGDPGRFLGVAWGVPQVSGCWGGYSASSAGTETPGVSGPAPSRHRRVFLCPSTRERCIWPRSNQVRMYQSNSDADLFTGNRQLRSAADTKPPGIFS